jgi:hypothetical protein
VLFSRSPSRSPSKLISAMLSKLFLAAAALATHASAHATFQAMWINGVDYGSACVRVPLSNSPVTDVTSVRVGFG